MVKKMKGILFLRGSFRDPAQLLVDLHKSAGKYIIHVLDVQNLF